MLFTGIYGPQKRQTYADAPIHTARHVGGAHPGSGAPRQRFGVSPGRSRARCYFRCVAATKLNSTSQEAVPF